MVLNYDLGWGAISSASSWLDNDAYLAGIGVLLGVFWFRSAYFADNTCATDIFVEELRLTSQLDGPLQFVARALL